MLIEDPLRDLKFESPSRDSSKLPAAEMIKRGLPDLLKRAPKERAVFSIPDGVASLSRGQLVRGKRLSPTVSAGTTVLVESSNHPFERNPAIARHDELVRPTPIGPRIDSHRRPPVFRAELARKEHFAIDEPRLLGAIGLEHEAEHPRLLVIVQNDEGALLPRLKRRVAESRRFDALWKNAADCPQGLERPCLPRATAHFFGSFAAVLSSRDPATGAV
jgi:hypothetical protein